LIGCVTGFDIVLELHQLLHKREYESKLLQNLFSFFPREEISDLLIYFREIFDEKQAKRDGFIRPLVGVDTEYDETKALVADIEKSFDAYLLEQKRETGIRELSYFGSNKDRFQMEVPMSQVHRVPKLWTSKSQKKTHRRFWSPFVEENLSRLTEAEERYKRVIEYFCVRVE
jgi:DNA mismatch repair protein MSH6